MAYKVIKFFTDLKDAEHPYNVGDTFPRPGMDVPDSRIEELAGPNNLQGTPLIELVKDVAEEDESSEAAEETTDEPTEDEEVPKKKKRSKKKDAE